MIIMALDHVRDYFHYPAWTDSPTNLLTTTPILFFTRWITHFCAPTFLFLSGISAYLMGQKKSGKELCLSLLKRIWLILLELTVVNFGWNFDITFTNIYFIVIWALGVSMIALAALIHLPLKLILLVGVSLVAGHNLLDHIHVGVNGLGAFGWALLHEQNFFNWNGKNVLSRLPGSAMDRNNGLRYCLGSLFTPTFTAEKRKEF